MSYQLSAMSWATFGCLYFVIRNCMQNEENVQLIADS